MYLFAIDQTGVPVSGISAARMGEILILMISSFSA